MNSVTTLSDEAAEVARRVAAVGPGDRLIERLAEVVGAKANIATVFGEPIQRGDITVIPVARVRWGFGGGAGQAADTSVGEGSGGGGGVMADPIGYIEVTTSGAEFRPIRASYPSPAFVLAAGLATAIVLGAVRRLVRR